MFENFEEFVSKLCSSEVFGKKVSSGGLLWKDISRMQF